MGKNVEIDYVALKEDLKNKGYKLTPQRRAIVDTIVESEGKHLTQLKRFMIRSKKCPEIGLATVYRTILLLEDIGILSRLHLNNRDMIDMNSFIVTKHIDIII